MCRDLYLRHVVQRDLAHLVWQPPKGDEHIADAGLWVRDLSDETVDDKGQHAADDYTCLRAHPARWSVQVSDLLLANGS